MAEANDKNESLARTLERQLTRINEGDRELNTSEAVQLHIEERLREIDGLSVRPEAASLASLLQCMDAVNDTGDAVSVSVSWKGRLVDHMKLRPEPTVRGEKR